MASKQWPSDCSSHEVRFEVFRSVGRPVGPFLATSLSGFAFLVDRSRGMERVTRSLQRSALGTAQRKLSRRRRRSDAGDTLVEVLLALIILGTASVALLIAFSTSIAASGEHRNLAVDSTVLATASQEIISQIQNTSSLFSSACNTSPPNSAPAIKNYPYYSSGVPLPAPYNTGSYVVQYVNTTSTSVSTGTPTIQYWNGSSYQLGCLNNVPQLITIGLSGTTYTNSFVVQYPVGNSNGFVSGGIASALTWYQQPAQATTTIYAGSPFPVQPIIDVTDGANAVTTDLSPVTFAITYATGSGVLSGCQGNEILGVVTFTGCSISSGGTYQITAYDGNLQSVASTSFVVASSSYSLVFYHQPVAGPSGTSFTTSPAIEVLVGGTVSKSWSGTITLSISGGSLANCTGTPTTSYILTSTANENTTTGIWTLPSSCYFSGGYFYNPNSSPQVTATQYTMTATANPTAFADAAVPALSNTFSVSSFGTATQLVFSTEPTGVASASASTAFTGQPSVTVEDAYGNVVTNASNTLTMTMSLGATNETLQNCTYARSEGTYTYSGCGGNGYNSNLKLTVAGGSLTSATSTPFNITRVASQLLFTTSPVAGASGSTFPKQPVLVVEDSFNQVVTAATASVTLQPSPTSGSLATCTGLVPNLGVVNVASCTFTGIVGTQYTLTATAGGLTSAPSAAFSPTGPGVASKLVFTTSPVAGASGSLLATQPVVAVEDAAGNIVTSSSAFISFAAPPGTLTSCPSITASAGVANVSNCAFGGVVNTSYNFVASSGTLTSATSAISPTAPGPISQIVMSGCPLSITVTSTCTETATLEDAYGNVETLDNSSVGSFTRISGTGAVTGFASTAVVSGVANVVFTATVAGPVTFDATADSVTSNSVTLTVNAVPSITTTSLAGATDTEVGYSQSLVGANGTVPYSWAIATGTLPTGLNLNSTTGIIAGTIGSAATSQTFTVRITDADGVTATKSLSVVVSPAPIITTTSLPTATDTETGYSQTLAVTGGATPYGSWLVLSGTLPTGLNLNSTTGIIAGTIGSAATTQTFTVQITDANGASDTQVLTLTVNAVPNITTTSLPGATKTGTYSQTLATTGGTTPFTWSLASGSLPLGLSLNASTGVISGTVSSSATAQTFTVKVVDANSINDTQSLTIAINAAPSISTTTLPGATKTGTYSQTLATTGGTTPFTWSLASGSLPLGLSLNASTGVISGTVSSSASAQTFTVRVIDADAVSATQSLTISVNAVPTVTTTSLATATDTQTGYSQTLAGTLGTTPYSWTITTGSLPTGLGLNASTGVIAGTVGSAATTKTFTVTLTDANGVTASKSLTLTVNSATNITTATVPGATKGFAYSSTLAVTGGTTPYGSWSLSTGSLPTGLSLNTSTGVISGIVGAGATTQTFVVQIADANAVNNTQSLTLTVNAAPNITTTSLPAGKKNTLYTQTLTVSGGTSPLTWTLSSGALPTGITLNASTGVISGTSTTTASQNFTVKATDANGASDTQPLTLTINS
jgi:hypothetical protein